jgi:hypothetical protein
MKKVRFIICFCLFFLFYVGSALAQESQKPVLVKLPFAFSRRDRGELMENTPVIFNTRLLLVVNYRPSGGPEVTDEEKDSYLYIDDLLTGTEIIRFGKAHSFVSAFVNDDELNVFALDFSETGKVWSKNGISRFVTKDLKNWKTEKVILPESEGYLFNNSVCQDDKGFVMAYESNKPVQWCFKFARSNDLSKWEKIPGLVFTGVNHEMAACPAIRYLKPYYYVIFGHDLVNVNNRYTSDMARSKNLIDWELSPYNPILQAGKGEGINNTDVDIIEYEGRTYLFYATGDQATWATIRVAMYDGEMKTFFESHFPEGEIFKKFSAKY